MSSVPKRIRDWTQCIESSPDSVDCANNLVRIGRVYATNGRSDIRWSMWGHGKSCSCWPWWSKSPLLMWRSSRFWPSCACSCLHLQTLRRQPWGRQRSASDQRRLVQQAQCRQTCTRQVERGGKYWTVHERTLRCLHSVSHTNPSFLWAACVTLKPFPHVKPVSSNFSSPSTAIKHHPLFIKLKSFANTAWHSNLLTVFAYSLIGGILHPRVIWICSLSKQTFFLFRLNVNYSIRAVSSQTRLCCWFCEAVLNFSVWRFSNLFESFVSIPFWISLSSPGS